jgi:hypothetical protein
LSRKLAFCELRKELTWKTLRLLAIILSSFGLEIADNQRSHCQQCDPTLALEPAES